MYKRGNKPKASELSLGQVITDNGKIMWRKDTLDSIVNGKRVFLPIDGYWEAMRLRVKYEVCSPTYIDEKGRPYQITN